jgi:hypothetical protein
MRAVANAVRLIRKLEARVEWGIPDLARATRMVKAMTADSQRGVRFAVLYASSGTGGYKCCYKYREEQGHTHIGGRSS